MKIHLVVAVALTAVGAASALAGNERSGAATPLALTPSVEITSQEPTDEQLAADVRQRLREHSSLKFFRIDVRSVDHAIYLYGETDTRVDVDEAGDVARSVPGVRRIYNYLYSSNG